MVTDKKIVLLSFDTEEFDVPKERGVDIPLPESMRISEHGTNRILDVLERHGAVATFFCTTVFAENASATMRRIIDNGHEVASHGCDHWHPVPEDVITSRARLQQLTGTPVLGFRQPRMFAVSDADIRRAGYLYNSSLNPTFIPGHYMHLNKPRTPFINDGVVQIPTAVTPLVRFPLFWLAYHHLPAQLYRRLALRCLRHDGYFTTYFHPWEFYDTGSRKDLKLSFVHNRNAGEEMVRRLDALVETFLNVGAEFSTYTPFAKKILEDGK